MCGHHLALRASVVPTLHVFRIEHRICSHVRERGPCNLCVVTAKVTLGSRQLLVGRVVELVGALMKSLTVVCARVWRLSANVGFEVLDGGAMQRKTVTVNRGT